MKSFFISIVAPIVKLFPTWALKFTKKSNKYAMKFQLSSQGEIAYLLKHSQSAEWVGERIWNLQTRKYMFGLKDTRPELFEAFISCVDNGIVYDAAYEIVPEEAIKAKGYTLDANRVIKACDDNVNYLYVLAEKQPQSFRVDVVRKLSSNRKEAYFSYIFTKCKWEKLAELDVILFDDAKENKTAANYLSFLMGLTDYKPNLSAEQLSSLSDTIDKWCQNADSFIVADKMSKYWHQKENFEAINNLLQRLIKSKASSKRDEKARQLLQMLPSDIKYYADNLHLMLEQGIACPLAFKFLFDQEDEVNINFNLALCINQKIEGEIPERIFERFSINQKEKLLIAMAKDGVLSEKRLAQAPNNKTKKELLDILEEKAQIKWFEPLLGKQLKDEYIKILDNCYKTGKIYATLQDLTFKDDLWVEVFVERNWYDEAHKIKLMQSEFTDSVSFFMEKYGVTQAQFEALLTGPNANLAPEAKLFMNRKNEDSFFGDGDSN